MTAPAASHDDSSAPEGRPLEVSEDRLLGGRVRLRQPRAGYRAAIDPVLLAAAVPADPRERVLDLGCGVGAAALCLLARVSSLHLVGLELQRPLLRLARDNAALNRALGFFDPIGGDVLHPPPRLAPGTFHHVMLNPPYRAPESGDMPRDSSHRTADVEGSAQLADWLRTAFTMVQAKGSVTLIHRADRLEDVVAAFAGRGGEIVVFPLWEREGRPARRVIVRARKGIATPTRLLSGLVLHDEEGAFTPAADTILREAAALEF